MVQLTGDFVTSLGMIAIRFIQGAQATPNDPFHALSERRIGRIDVIGKYGQPTIGGLFAFCAQRPRAISHMTDPHALITPNGRSGTESLAQMAFQTPTLITQAGDEPHSYPTRMEN